MTVSSGACARAACQSRSAAAALPTRSRPQGNSRAWPAPALPADHRRAGGMGHWHSIQAPAPDGDRGGGDAVYPDQLRADRSQRAGDKLGKPGPVAHREITVSSGSSVTSASRMAVGTNLSGLRRCSLCRDRARPARPARPRTVARPRHQSPRIRITRQARHLPACVPIPAPAASMALPAPCGGPAAWERRSEGRIVVVSPPTSAVSPSAKASSTIAQPDTIGATIAMIDLDDPDDDAFEPTPRADSRITSPGSSSAPCTVHGDLAREQRRRKPAQVALGQAHGQVPRSARRDNRPWCESPGPSAAPARCR